MSAYNEEAVICGKAEALIAMADAYGPAEILVYVDGPQDRTLELLSHYSDRICIFPSTERRGKTAGLKLLVGSSTSELLAFTDANVISSPDCLIGLQAALRDPTVGCASARLVYTNAEESETSRGGAQYWSREELIKTRESDTIGMIGVDGSLFMIRRDIYESPPDDIIDDLYTSLIALLKGYHVMSVPAVVVYERNATSVREEFYRKARISCQGINVHRLLWPRLRRLPAAPLYGYISHRLLKWMVPFFLLGAPIFAVAGAVEIIGLFETSVCLLGLAAVFAIGLAMRVPLLLRISAYCLMVRRRRQRRVRGVGSGPPLRDVEPRHLRPDDVAAGRWRSGRDHLPCARGVTVRCWTTKPCRAVRTSPTRQRWQIAGSAS